MAPQARHVFLRCDSLSYAFPIVHVEDHWLYFSSQQNLPGFFETGHFLAEDQKGIVRFDNPQIESLKEQTKKDLDLQLHRIDFGSTSYEVTNRRQAPRHNFKDFLPMSFNIFGESMAAQLVNISQGGLQMNVDTPLKTNILCHLELKLPQNEKNVLLKTNGMVVYCGKEAEKSKYSVGLSFITPEFVSAENKAQYIESQKILENFIAHHM